MFQHELIMHVFFFGNQLILLLNHHFAVVLVFEELLVEDADEGVLVALDILSHLVLGVAQFLNNRLHDLFIEPYQFFRVRSSYDSARMVLLLIQIPLLRALGSLIRLMTVEELVAIRKQFLAILQPVAVGGDLDHVVAVARLLSRYLSLLLFRYISIIIADL